MFGFRRRGRSATPQEPAAVTAPPVLDVQKLLHRLQWTVLRRLDGQLQGDYRSLFRGSGMELADLREYQPHDDVRHIDWNVTARMQTPYVREHQEDREMTAWLVMDLSGSVAFGSGPRSKRDVAVEVSGVLARMLSRRGNPVGALLHSGQHAGVGSHIPPGSGTRHVLHIMDQVARCVAPAQGAETDLAVLLGQALARVRRRSTVLVVSDFISREGWEQALGHLARRHEVIAVRLRDPMEHQLPVQGMLLLRDAETGEQLLVDTQDRQFRQRFADQALSRETALRASFARAGVDCLELRTDEAIDAALLDFMALRNPRARQGIRRA